MSDYEIENNDVINAEKHVLKCLEILEDIKTENNL